MLSRDPLSCGPQQVKMHDAEVGGVEASQSADATPTTAAALRVAVQGEEGSTGDRPSPQETAPAMGSLRSSRRMSGDDVLTELLLDAGAAVDEVPQAQTGPGAAAADGRTSTTL